MKIDVTELKKHEDPRGVLFEVLRRDETDEDIKLIHFSTSKKGAVRGGHYHKRRVEWFCVVKGEGKLVIEDNETGEKKELILSGESPILVKIPPNTKHSIQNIGEGEMYLISVTNEVFNPKDSDTFKL